MIVTERYLSPMPGLRSLIQEYKELEIASDPSNSKWRAGQIVAFIKRIGHNGGGCFRISPFP